MMENNVLGYLAVPVWPNYGGDRKVLRVFRGEQMIFEFLVSVSGDLEKKPAWHAHLPIQRVYEKKLRELVGEDICQEEAFDISEIRIETEDARLKENCFFTDVPTEAMPEAARPQRHFAPPYGWMNDPNGMIFDGKVWHLYFQHNPMDAAWCNMTWGHAVSEDLVHFTWQGDVLFPDSRGVMYSGCAILNGQDGGVRVFPQLPADALVFFYTSAGAVGKGTSSENGVF
ncbi:MAG: hypothetical protein ACSW8H_04225, partial [bacterium]